MEAEKARPVTNGYAWSGRMRATGDVVETKGHLNSGDSVEQARVDGFGVAPLLTHRGGIRLLGGILVKELGKRARNSLHKICAAFCAEWRNGDSLQEHDTDAYRYQRIQGAARRQQSCHQ